MLLGCGSRPQCGFRKLRRGNTKPRFWLAVVGPARTERVLSNPLPLVGRGWGGGLQACGDGALKRELRRGEAPHPCTPPHKGEGVLWRGWGREIAADYFAGLMRRISPLSASVRT